MKAMTRAIAIALLQILLICSLGAKLLYDRKTCQQAWFKWQYDRIFPIRGRYWSLRLEMRDPLSHQEIEARFKRPIDNFLAEQKKRNLHEPFGYSGECGKIAVQDGIPVAVLEQHGWMGECRGMECLSLECDQLTFVRRVFYDGHTDLRLTQPVLFFIPHKFRLGEHASRGDEMWVLATIPRKGPPRPIALGVKKPGESEIHRLAIN